MINNIEKIVQILKEGRGEPLSTKKIHERAKTGKIENSTRNSLKWLEKVGVAERVLDPKKKRTAWIHGDFSMKKLAQTKSQLRDDIKKMHTFDLKSVIKEWVSQIPYPSNERECPGGTMPIHRFNVTPCMVTCSERIEIEDHHLFSDLENHLPFDPNLFEKWKNFKQKFGEFEGIKSEFFDKISRKLSKDLKLQVITSNQAWQLDSISTHFPQYVYDVYILVGEGRGKLIKDHFSWGSKVEEKSDGSYEYWVGSNGFVKIKKEKESKQKFQNRMEMYRKRLIEKIKGKKLKTFVDTAKKIVEMRKEIEKLKEDIVNSLEKNLTIPVFPGNCEILEATLS